MAAVSVAFDGTRWSDAEAIAPTTPFGGDWWDQAGTAPVLEPDFIYQGTYSISEKVKAAEVGVGWVPDAAVDMTTTKRVLIMKTLITTVGILSSTTSTGANIEVGSGGRRIAYYKYYHYYGNTYPVNTSWLITAVDPNLPGYANATTGSPAATAINWVSWVATMTTTTAKSENIAMDALDYVTNGTGLTLTGGSSTDADGTFENFRSFDQGTSTNRYGICTAKDGVFYVVGVLTIGSGTETDFTDLNQTVVFPDGYFETGFCGIDLSLANASSVISLTSITMVGKGSRGFGSFDTTSGVDGTNEIITTFLTHKFNTGDYVLYSKNGGSAAIGLTDATSYYVRALSTTTLAVYTTKNNAIADTTRVGLTASGAETHSLTKNYDTRPDFGVASTSGVATIDSCSLQNFNTITLTSGVTLTDSVFNACQSLTPAQAIISNCTFDSSPVAIGVAFATVVDPADLSSCSFISGGSGHAIELTSTTGSPFTFNGNTFSGYGPNLFAFHTTDDVNAATDVVTELNHGYATGDPIRYMKQGGSVNMGLTDNTTYYVRAVSTDTLAFYASQNNATTDASRLPLTSTGSETHYINSMNAAIYNNSGGSITLNISTGGVPSVRNGTNATTTIVSSKTVDVHVQDAATANIQSAVVAIYKTTDDSVVSNSLTDSGGDITQTSVPTGTAIYVRVRKSTSGTRYYPVETVATISDNLALTITLIEDTNAP